MNTSRFPRNTLAILGSVVFTTLLVSPYDFATLGQVFLTALQVAAPGLQVS